MSAEPRTLAARICAVPDPHHRVVCDPALTIPVARLAAVLPFASDPRLLEGANILLRTGEQLATVHALIALDGLAARILLCPPDLDPAHLPAIAADGGADTLVTDLPVPEPLGLLRHVRLLDHAAPGVRPASPPKSGARATEWILFTSGTSGRPKLVRHTLETLAGPAADGTGGNEAIWATFYDIRRYGGLQILLRALAGGGSMLLSDTGAAAALLGRFGACGVTHISGTPSHWRRALMSGAAEMIAPRYVRLSGEIADQAILDRLAANFPGAAISHAFASTEAGVVFEVRDGRSGFPAALLDDPGPGFDLAIRDGTLRVRSPRTAFGYLGAHAPALRNEDGYVDTGDVVLSEAGRCHFAGRREGLVNVGGAKVHPEEVEAVINRHPAVVMSRVWPRPSPVTGALVMADIVLRNTGALAHDICAEVTANCRAKLAPYKVPVRLRVVPAIAVLPSGKIDRRHA